MKAIYILAGAALLSTGLACGGSGDKAGSSSDALTLHGTVSPTTRKLDNARALAISSTGKTYWAYLDVGGNFKLQLPAGHAYRVLIANTLKAGGFRTIGHLTINTSSGSKVWLGARFGGLVDLGALHVVDTSTTAGVTTKDDKPDLGGASSGSASDEKDHEHDFDCHEDDDHEDEKVCKGEHDDDDDRDDDTDLEVDHDKDPGDKCDDKDLDDKDDDKDKEDKEIEKPCGGGGSSGAPPPPPPASSGGSGLNAPCAVNTDCSGVLVCVASVCTAPLR